MVLVIAYTTLLAPFWIKSYYKAFGHCFDRAEAEAKGENLRGS